ncbi:MAG: ATP-binding protein [Dysgonamonadaceae bacterium]|jgi:predicted AAA+ superfamily ATPase|nr:ATP-binding protein [Dysgonamonadaceae bacterium]
MDKEIIKRIIREKQDEISNTKLVIRHFNLELVANYVFIGLRRAGKSYLMYQHILNSISSGAILPEQVLYVNFEDERISSIQAKDLGLLLDAFGEMYDKKPCVFLDEIQNIDGWHKFVRRIADSKYRVFVTGSNAKMLSKDVHTTLGGRFLFHEVFPFSFAEYLKFNNLELRKNWIYGNERTQVIKLFSNYFYFGGFAETFVINDRRAWLNSLYHKILFGDIIVRNEIRNENAIRMLVKKLAESVMQPMSLSRLNNSVDSTGAKVSRNTLVDYLQYLSDAYLIFSISNFSDKFLEKETFKKRYFFDNGLLNIFLINRETALLENLVAIELRKRYDEDLFFYNKNVEVDFYLPEAKMAVQVCYSLNSDIDTRKRETGALVQIAKRFEIEFFLIITKDEEETISENSIEIQVIPVWKWLLENELS